MAAKTDFVTLNLPSLSPEKPAAKSHSCWRQWKQLSRFQRSLVYMFFIVAAIIYILVYSGRSAGHHSSRGQSTVASHRLEESESEKQHRGGLPLVEAAEKVDVQKFNGGDGDEQNMAGEDKDDEEDDEDEDEEEEEDEEDFEGGDSNNANEEENEKSRKFGGPKNNHGVVAADGSIKFGGPQNERQRAVVSAFQHAWQVTQSQK